MSRFEYAEVDPSEVISVLESIKEEYMPKNNHYNWLDHIRTLAIDYAIAAIKGREDDLK